jgi:hypothetical protein
MSMNPGKKPVQMTVRDIEYFHELFHAKPEISGIKQTAW